LEVVTTSEPEIILPQEEEPVIEEEEKPVEQPEPESEEEKELSLSQLQRIEEELLTGKPPKEKKNNMVQKEKIIIQGKDLIEELGLEYLSLEEQEELLVKIIEVVYSRVLERVLERLTEGEAAQVAGLIKEERFAEANNLLEGKVFDFDKILRRELFDFEQEIVQAIK